MTALHEWESFYVIVGSSAGALIGLQFVVMTLWLKTHWPEARQWEKRSRAQRFVHFAIVLLLSAIVSAPWHSIRVVAILLGLIGLGGLVYVIIVMQRIRTQIEQACV